MHKHLLDSTQQHLLLLMNDSVEKKRTIDDLLTDSDEKKNTIKELLSDSVELTKARDSLLADSVGKKRTMDELLVTNEILNHNLKKVKADFDLLKETVHINQVKNVDMKIGDILIELQKSPYFFYKGFFYRRIKTKSLPYEGSLHPDSNIGINISFDPLKISFTREAMHVWLLNTQEKITEKISVSMVYNHYFMASQYVVTSQHEYRWVESYEELKELGFIVNDIFILKVNFDDTEW